MRKIIKPGNVISSDSVVKIPDATPPPIVQPPEAQEQEQEFTPVLKTQKILDNSAKNRADELSAKILQRARDEREMILEQARTEAQRIREEARQSAYQQVLEEKHQQISDCLSEVERLMNDLQKQQQNFLKQYEDGIFSLALDIAKKILGATIKEHEELMIPLVKEAVASVKDADWISVEISEKLPHLIEKLKSELAKYQNFERIEVHAAVLPEDGCIIHTPNGIVDASVSVQLENLKAEFEKSR